MKSLCTIVALALACSVSAVAHPENEVLPRDPADVAVSRVREQIEGKKPQGIF